MTLLQTREEVEADLESSIRAFGLALKHWRKSNGWSQETAEEWASCTGSLILYNSQWSKLENGKTPQPGPLIFRALGAMNQRIADEDWGTNLTDALRRKLEGSKPVLTEDGKVWRANDFYAAFIGEKTFPCPTNTLPIGMKSAQRITDCLVNELAEIPLNQTPGKGIHTTEAAIAAFIQAGANLDMSLDLRALWVVRFNGQGYELPTHEDLICLANELLR